MVQVRPLGTIFRKIPQAAPPLIRRRDDGRILAHPPQPDDLSLQVMPRRAEMLRRNGGVDSPAEWLGKAGDDPVELY